MSSFTSHCYSAVTVQVIVKVDQKLEAKLRKKEARAYAQKSLSRYFIQQPEVLNTTSQINRRFHSKKVCVFKYTQMKQNQTQREII